MKAIIVYFVQWPSSVEDQFLKLLLFSRAFLQYDP